jgi:hypothetical protein
MATGPVQAPARPAPGGRAGAAGGADETVLLRRLLAICSHLSTLASQTCELTPILGILADTTGCTATVVGPALEVLGSAQDLIPGGIADQLHDPARQSTLRVLLSAAARNRRALAAPDPASGPLTLVAPACRAQPDAAGAGWSRGELAEVADCGCEGPLA